VAIWRQITPLLLLLLLGAAALEFPVLFHQRIVNFFPAAHLLSPRVSSAV
jgi:hypothetical protein